MEHVALLITSTASGAACNSLTLEKSLRETTEGGPDAKANGLTKKLVGGKKSIKLFNSNILHTFTVQYNPDLAVLPWVAS